MKVKELIQALAALDPEAEVILSSDEEGNSYHEIMKDCLLPCVVSRNGHYEIEFSGGDVMEPDQIPPGSDLISAVVIYPC